MKNKNGFRCQWEGSFAVEAALIMPLLVFIVFAFIFFAFYLHDKNKLQRILNEGVEKAVLRVNKEGSLHGEEIYFEKINDRGPLFFLLGDLSYERSQLEQFFKEELQGGFYLARPGLSKLALSHQGVEAEIMLKPDIPVRQAAKYFKDLPVKAGTWMGIHQPAEFVRRYTVLGEAVGEKLP